MDVTLLVHQEAGDQGVVWWAESPEVPGFSATDVSLDGLRARARDALRDIAADRGEGLGTVSTVLTDDVTAGSSPPRSEPR